MKKRLLLAALTLVIAVLAGVLAFVACFHASVPECCRDHHPLAKELGWLQHEYHLSDAQLERVHQLHADFTPRCAEMCRRVGIQRARLSTLIQAGHEASPEVAEALKTTAALELECRQASLSHIYAVAAAMPPEEGRRYIATMTAAIVAPGMPAGKAGNSAMSCDMNHPQ